MIRKKSLGKILVLALLFNTFFVNAFLFKKPRPYQTTSYWDNSTGFNFSDVRNIALVGAIAGAVCYGFYKLGSWWFYKSDEIIIRDSRRSFQFAHLQYASFIELLQDNIQFTDSSIHTVDESLLYKLAVAKLNKEPIEKYVAQLNRTINTLRNECTVIQERMNKLKNQFGPHCETNNYLTMRQIAKNIERLLPRLEFLHRYFVHHKSYFRLFELESHLMYYYEKELNAYSASQEEFNHEITTCVMIRQSENRNKYPFLHYANILTANIKKFRNALGRVAYNYYDRASAARMLEAKLDKIRAVVVTEKSYQQELRASERERLERQKIAVQQAQAEAQQQQAYAQQQQAWALEKQNRLKEKEMREKKDSSWL